MPGGATAAAVPTTEESCRLPIDSRGPPMLPPLARRGVEAVDAGEKVLYPSLSM